MSSIFLKVQSGVIDGTDYNFRYELEKMIWNKKDMQYQLDSTKISNNIHRKINHDLGDPISVI